ncbi:MAG: N-acetyl-alpha-D-glucosaminyl L-malate synthase BshA [Bacteroidia bacterium]|nr:N-acetyl-alpha-D-glucosaminyl L-malate synthase BshA [Bacteroidia bacterium]MDW8134289.1 N-acetyl-alpha-D-glucosaminyl L-malate synthase BshA [Bacteroidia bacterium]
MQIGIVCFPVIGGSGVVATELARALACKGHVVHLISSDPPLRYTPCLPYLYFHQVAPPDYPLFQYKPYESALAGRLFRLAEEGMELVHVHYAIPHAVSAYLAQKALEECGIYLPVITTLHGTDTKLVKEYIDLHAISKMALQSSTVVTAVSLALARETEIEFSLSAPPVVIPNFVDTHTFSPKRRDESLRVAYASPEEFLLVHASNFRPIKQTPQIIYLFAELLETGLPVRLLMIGDGAERPICERLAQSLGVENKVCFTGGVAELSSLLAIGDVFVLTSAYESFGLAALEAMACGVPVVAPAVGGLPEVIRPEGGRLFSPGDLRSAREAILKVIQSLPAYKQGARQVALTYDTHKIVPLYESLYAEAKAKVSTNK